MQLSPQPGRIRAARELRALTQAEVVGQMIPPISTAALSQFEVGKARPSAQTQSELARVLDVPLGFFGAQSPGGDSAALYFRDLRSTTSRQRKRAGALALLAHELLRTIEAHLQLPELNLPVENVARDASRQQVEEAAWTVRAMWNLGHDPVPHVVRELERNGVAVARLTLGHRHVDAFTARFSRRPIVLLTDDKTSYVRSRFDAAHELGHLVMHAESPPGDRWVEAQAHDFAAAFLLPRRIAVDVLPERLDRAGWNRLAELKLEWGMSMAALLYRAHSLQILSDDSYRNAMKQMSIRGWRTVEPGDRELGRPESPVLMERALRTITIESGRPKEDLVVEANLPLADTLALIQATADQRPRVDI